jgi:hypothetical protein
MVDIGLNHNRRVVFAIIELRNRRYSHKEDADHEIIKEITTTHRHSISTKVGWVH